MENAFRLKKLTVETLGVSCQYETETKDGDGTVYNAVLQKKDSRIPHSGLRNLFEVGLAKVVATICHLNNEGLDLPTIVPTTIKLSGKDNAIGISISGHFIYGLTKIQFKTSKIKYKAADNDFCAELTVLVEQITAEIKKYLFDGMNETVEVFE